MEVIFFKLVLVIYTLNAILPVLLKPFGLRPDMSRLSCGITAFCGSVPADPNIIKMIMMFNMERGEDSTGWAVNNRITKDTEKVSKFLTMHNLETSEEDENYTVVAHARKSSSGAKFNKDLAHPFGIYSSGVEKKNYDLILAMNGTLDNTDLISDAFEIEYKTGTDSDTKVLSKAMAKLGEKEYIKVLEGYSGTATLVFYNPKYKNTLMVYKDPLRTLFYWKKSEVEMYISSMEEPLVAVGALKEEIIPFESEMLYRIVKGKIVKESKIIRTPLRPKAKYSTLHTSVSRFNRRDEQYEGICGYPLNGPPQKSFEFSRLDDLTISIKPEEKKKSHHRQRGNVVYVINDKYYRNGHPIESGFYWITKSGKVKDYPTDEEKKHAGIRKCYFINGLLCKNEDEYNKIIKKCSDENEVFQVVKYKKTLLSELVDHFEYPVLTIVDNKEKWIIGRNYSNGVSKKGDTIELNMFLSNSIYTLRYNQQWTKMTHKEVCDLVNIRDKSPQIEIPDTTPSNIEEEMEYLLALIKTKINPIVTSSAWYYTAMRTDVYKGNPSYTTRNKFYGLLLSLLFRESVINSDNFADLKKRGDAGFFASHDFIKEMDRCIELLITRIKNKSVEKEKVEIVEDVYEHSSTIENEFSYKDCIESIKESNVLFKREEFKNDFTDGAYDTFDDFMKAWINNGICETGVFCEAVLLCLHDLGHIDDSHLLLIVQENITYIRSKAENHYMEWHEDYNIKCEQAIGAFTSNAPEVNPEDLSFQPAEMSPEEIEAESIDEMNNIMNMMKDHVRLLESLDGERKTDYTRRIESELGCAIDFLNRRIFAEEVKVNFMK